MEMYIYHHKPLDFGSQKGSTKTHSGQKSCHHFTSKFRTSTTISVKYIQYPLKTYFKKETETSSCFVRFHPFPPHLIAQIQPLRQHRRTVRRFLRAVSVGRRRLGRLAGQPGVFHDALDGNELHFHGGHTATQKHHRPGEKIWENDVRWAHGCDISDFLRLMDTVIVFKKLRHFIDKKW